MKRGIRMTLHISTLSRRPSGASYTLSNGSGEVFNSSQARATLADFVRLAEAEIEREEAREQAEADR